ncbi:MAG: 2-dehydro-3-deoxygalactonokinase [Pseudomonadales bacterium]|nr:2-dehydro-3-deoxygalactonokinase [Pseudomonadales bacterium]
MPAAPDQNNQQLDPHLICVDWGTTHMRAYLCAIQPDRLQLLATVNGPGIAQAKGDCARLLFTATQDWNRQYGKLPYLLSGMVGSTLGWQQVAYQACPAAVRELAEACLLFTENGHRIAIVPGVSVTNPLAQADVMRGEELQVLGWLQASAADPEQDALLCLPGTHTKWVLLQKGHIVSFVTGFSGELYALLKQHSILLGGNKNPALQQTGFDQSFAESFTEGVAQAQTDGSNLLIHQLFSVRSRQVQGLLAAEAAADYLSGLIIGSDVAAAIKSYGPHMRQGNPVAVIGSDDLCARYGLALQQFSCTSRGWRAQDVALAGYHTLYTALIERHSWS